jgi:hypothetical protein
MPRIFLPAWVITTLLLCLIQPAWSQDDHSVRIVNKPGSPFMEIRNGFIGLVIPKQESFDPKNPLAPLQSVIYANGAYSDNTPNLLYGASQAISMKVNIVTNTPSQCVVVISYTFNKIEFRVGTQKYKNGEAGPGYYKTTITLTKGSHSAMMEEEADYDVGYTLKISEGLNPDKARWRGDGASSSKQFGYEPSGEPLRGFGTRPPVDATIDLHYDKRIEYDFMSFWNPGGEVNAANYCLVYNAAAPSSANLVGFFQGRPSRMIGARSCGIQLVTEPSPSYGVLKDHPESNIASILVRVLRRGPDNIWFPRKRYQWCLYANTKADLLPPGQIQPIAKEMNLIAGLAGRVDNYLNKPAIIIPKFTDGALYLPADKVQALIKRIKTDNDFYNKIVGTDPYFKPVADAWRSKEAASTAIRQFIELNRALPENYKNGEGIHSFDYGYSRGARNFKDMTVQISCLLADKDLHISASQEDSLIRVVRLMARIEWDDDNVPLFDSSGANFGPTNMYYQFRNSGRNFFAMVFAGDPEFRQRAKDVLATTRNDITEAIAESGASIGTPHYTQATMDPILFTMLQLKQAGVANLFTEQKARISKFISFFTSLLTPPSVRFKGDRKLVSIGDGSEESAALFGLLASGYEDSDPSLSKRLYGIFQNGPERLTIFGTIAMAVDFQKVDPPLLKIPSSDYTGYLSHLRSGTNTDNETAAWIVNGEFYSDHRHDDRGEVIIYALKTPLSLSRSCFYYPRADDARIRSEVIPVNEFKEWNTANQPIASNSPGGTSWNSSESIAFADLGTSVVSLSKISGKDKIWYRQVAMINIKKDQPVIILYDSVNNNKSNVWSMMFMSQNAVSTPAGPVTPVDRVYNFSGTSKQLPEASPEKNINPGLNRFIFTGQDWPKQMQSTGGINWDLYTLSPKPGSFTISQWTTNWQNSVELAEFQQTMGKPYSETQQILRIKSDAPFFHILLPYFKGSTPYANKVRAAGAGKMNIAYGNGELLISQVGWVYSSKDSLMAGALSSSSFSEKGISISGGPAEVEIIGKNVSVRIHGASGKRIISLPFAMSITQQANNSKIISNGTSSRIEIDYVKQNLPSIPNTHAFNSYQFNKK